MKKEERFTVKCTQGLGMGTVMVVVDNETGVNYLTLGAAAPTFATPLIGSDGNIIIDPPSLISEN